MAIYSGNVGHDIIGNVTWTFLLLYFSRKTTILHPSTFSYILLLAGFSCSCSPRLMMRVSMPCET